MGKNAIYDEIEYILIIFLIKYDTEIKYSIFKDNKCFDFFITAIRQQTAFFKKKQFATVFVFDKFLNVFQ